LFYEGDALAETVLSSNDTFLGASENETFWGYKRVMRYLQVGELTTLIVRLD